MEKVNDCGKTELGERVAKYMTEDIYIYMTVLRNYILKAKITLTIQ
jgi:hypothetical protein